MSKPTFHAETDQEKNMRFYCCQVYKERASWKRSVILFLYLETFEYYKRSVFNLSSPMKN